MTFNTSVMHNSQRCTKTVFKVKRYELSETLLKIYFPNTGRKAQCTHIIFTALFESPVIKIERQYYVTFPKSLSDTFLVIQSNSQTRRVVPQPFRLDQIRLDYTTLFDSTILYSTLHYSTQLCNTLLDSKILDSTLNVMDYIKILNYY